MMNKQNGLAQNEGRLTDDEASQDETKGGKWGMQHMEP